MRLLALCILVVGSAGCDSGVETTPLFEALAGDWQAVEVSQTLRFGPQDSFELVENGRLTAQGRISLAYAHGAGDAGTGDLAGVTSMDFTVQTAPNSSAVSSVQVLEITDREFTLRGCVVAPCGGAPVRSYVRTR